MTFGTTLEALNPFFFKKDSHFRWQNIKKNCGPGRVDIKLIFLFLKCLYIVSINIGKAERIQQFLHSMNPNPNQTRIFFGTIQ